MADTYECERCGVRHRLDDEPGASHLRFALSEKELANAVDFACTAGAHAYITDRTEQYVRDTEVFGVLGDKFSNAGFFSSRETAMSWLEDRVATNTASTDSILRRLQGEGGGEVDALRQINGSLRGLFSRAEFVRDAAGRIPSNTAGFDLQIVNRFNGEVLEQVQVKSNWSTDSNTLRGTVREFLANSHYDEDLTLAGPRELIDEARKMGVPNRLMVVGTVDGNRASGARLRELVEQGDVAVDGHLTLLGAAERVGKGAVIGAAVAVGVSAITNYLAYRRGRVTAGTAFRNIGVDGSRGAVIGGAMAGLSLLFPPGAAGIAIGVAVGSQLRRVVDIAYGKGAYADIIAAMAGVEASLEQSARGVAVVAKGATWMRTAQRVTTAELAGFDAVRADTDAKLAELRNRMGGRG